MSTIELGDLRAFLAVAEELHFGRAAARLHVAQSPLSRQIRQLEARLGTPLFTRTSRRVELTDAGAELVEPARRALGAVSAAVVTAQRAGRGEIGRLRVGFVDSAAYRLLPPLLRRFRAARPDVALHLTELTTIHQLEVLGRDIDVGIVRDPDPVPGIAFTRLVRENMTVAVPRTHRLAGDSVFLVDLAHEPFVMLPRDVVPNVHDRVLALCRSAGFSPRISQRALQHATILGLVEAGFGVAVLPESVRDSSRPGISFPLLRDDTARTELVLTYPDRTLRPVEEAFRALATARR